ncbi:MAG: serine/threonine protein kinase [Rhodospirillaceae bacterium]|nr:serine/threonine protein kinase [Rhodospirillaceae bacterium]
MTPTLVALTKGQRMGEVRRNQRGRLSFVYDEPWRQRRNAYPLSLSMPLAAAEHGHDVIEAFLWGLLPDNDRVLDRWARRFQVSARNAFALLSHVGEDCAGAVQFVSHERIDALTNKEPEPVVWLSEGEVAERLRTLREDHAAWRAPRDTGQFSLAGAQPKTAFLHENDRWGIPSGRTPTTHILKPPTGEFDGHAENEHFCLKLARRLGLPTASTQVMRFGNEVAIVIERYDRRRQDGEIHRVHQEDMCQALAVPPIRKYENEGGPGAVEIVDLLRAASSARVDDVATFVDALIFNWLIAGTDAHAKNYSVLIGAGGRARLAPLYDIASALPYDDMDQRALKLAMRVGGEYRLCDISVRDWRRLADRLRLPADGVLSRIEDLAAQLLEAAAAVREEIAREGLTHDVIDRLTERTVIRAVECARLVE